MCLPLHRANLFLYLYAHTENCILTLALQFVPGGDMALPELCDEAHVPGHSLGLLLPTKLPPLLLEDTCTTASCLAPPCHQTPQQMSLGTAITVDAWDKCWLRKAQVQILFGSSGQASTADVEKDDCPVFCWDETSEEILERIGTSFLGASKWGSKLCQQNWISEVPHMLPYVQKSKLQEQEKLEVIRDCRTSS